MLLALVGPATVKFIKLPNVVIAGCDETFIVFAVNAFEATPCKVPVYVFATIFDINNGRVDNINIFPSI
jgi:hypothetical protein